MPSPRKDVIGKYLANYAEPESSFGLRLHRHTTNVLVIPAQNESPSFIKGIKTALRSANSNGQRTLCIVVINSTDTHPPDVRIGNKALLDAFAIQTSAVPLHIENETPCWFVDTDDCDLLVIDRDSVGCRLPNHEGVGLARKIGCDLALAAIQSGSCHARLIHMSDCDVELPSDYFDVTIPDSCAAVIYRFFHKPCGREILDEAHFRYEAYLRYYVLGLRYAGSPYGFHTIGSCIAVTPEAYACVRGVPKRQAGEDFYLLNKLSKVGLVHTSTSSPIAINARSSLRVPFGTGQATSKITRNVNSYRIYNPRIFDLLKTWLTALSHLDGMSPSHAYDAIWRRIEGTVTPRDQDRLEACLLEIDAPKALREAMTQSSSPAVRHKWIRDWFDAFRTLKLIHTLRDHGIPDVLWCHALNEAPFCHLTSIDPDSSPSTDTSASEICRRLMRLEEQTQLLSAQND